MPVQEPAGRLGVLDSSEALQPTFGIERERIVSAYLGRQRSSILCCRGAEDSEDSGREVFLSHSPAKNDVAIGIAASGETPFVAGVLRAASMEGLSTIAIVGDPLGPVSDYASVVISPDRRLSPGQPGSRTVLPKN